MLSGTAAEAEAAVTCRMCAATVHVEDPPFTLDLFLGFAADCIWRHIADLSLVIIDGRGFR